jgi:hypothetical protein
VRLSLACAVVLALAGLSGCLGEPADPGGDGIQDPQPAGNETAGNGTAGNGTSSPSEDGGGDPSGGDEDGGEAGDGNGTDEPDDGSGDERPPWAAPGDASVRPGVAIDTPTGGCTTNYVFTGPANRTVLLGTAAHCFAENPDAGDGCTNATQPLEPGAEATVEGASQPATLVYSSWWTMQQAGGDQAAACDRNDFALVALADEDRGAVNPSVQVYGGPSGLASADEARSLDKVLYYGNSDTRPDSEEAQAGEGYLTDVNGWGATMYTLTPGVPGDSGAPVLTDDGRALGLLVTLQIVPPGGNGVTVLDPALGYAAQHGHDVDLATWDPADDGRLP